MDNEEWILRFSRPTLDVELKIYNTISELTPSSKYNHAKSVKDFGPTTHNGTLDEISSAVNEYLRQDYDTNAEESAEAPYEFEYVVFFDFPTNSIDIYTKLYTIGQEGATFYGSRVQRLDKSVFVAWIAT